jgi:ubiquitin-protein ligase
MLTDKGVRRVLKEIKELTSVSPKERGFTISFKEHDLQNFFAIVRSMDGDYKDGEYILHVKLPDNYPYSPPVISCETPNGRFQSNTNICLNISHFHSETWSPLITLEKIILSVMSIFYDNTISGVGSIISTPEEKKRLAMISHSYNMKYHNDILESEL